MAGGTLAPGRSSRTTKCEAPLFTCRVISKLLAGGRPNVDLYLDAIPPTPSRRRPRGALGLAQLLGTRT